MSSILVTGGTGTFGSTFIRACLDDVQWGRVICFSRDEVKQAQLAERFSAYPQLRMMLGDVRDPQSLLRAMSGVDTVVHAAALKRVDAGAYSPSEMILTNTFGTMQVINAAIAARVHRVMVISSDKAVQATNIYGATKFCGEVYAVQANTYGHNTGTRIAAVRYGNVLGSRGSVVHIWRDQLLRDLPLTLTHRDMTRFMMTIEDACTLVRYALGTMTGGEVFVPRLPRARMIDLANAVVHEHDDYEGEPFTERMVTWVGLRPGGEKLAESLLNEEEPLRTFARDDYYVITPSHHAWTTGDHWPVERLSADFVYRSDTGPFMTIDDLRQLLRRTAVWS